MWLIYTPTQAIYSSKQKSLEQNMLISFSQNENNTFAKIEFLKQCNTSPIYNPVQASKQSHFSKQSKRPKKN